MPTLRCEECGQQADDAAAGWRTYLGHNPHEDEVPFVATYYPECARREFDDPASEREQH